MTTSVPGCELCDWLHAGLQRTPPADFDLALEYAGLTPTEHHHMFVSLHHYPGADPAVFERHIGEGHRR